MAISKNRFFASLSIAAIAVFLLFIGTIQFGSATHESCSLYATEATCTAAAPECAWDVTNNHCDFSGGGIGPSCPIAGNGVCDYNACPSGCEWDAQGCVIGCQTGSPTPYCGDNFCGDGETAASCPSDCGSGGSCSPGFYMDPAINSCQVDCGYYTDQSSCTSYSECAWNTSGSSNYCYYSGTVPPPATTTGDAQVTGVVTDAFGSSVQDAFVEVHTPDRLSSFRDNTDSHGNYSIFGIPPGSYEIDVFPPQNSSGLISPPSVSVMLSTDQILTLDFSFVGATKTITGQVTLPDGGLIAGAFVDARRPDTGASAHTETDSTGNYVLSVTGGLWEIWVSPPASADWSYNQPPQTVIFADDSTSEQQILNFTVVSTNAAIIGKILRPDGSPPLRDTVFIDFKGPDGFFGTPVDSTGSFNVAVSAGTYSVFISVNDPGFSPPSSVSVTVASGETLNLGTITLVTASKSITGQVTRSDGTPVTDALVDAWQPNVMGGFANAKTDSSGNYTLLVTKGVWEVSVSPPSCPSDWNYNQQPQSVVFADDASTEVTTVNFTVVDTDAAVTGRILLPNGSPPLRDTVFVDVRSSGGSGFGGSVDSTGSFCISLTAGTYNMSIWTEDQSITAPQLAPITITSGETRDIGTITLVEATKLIMGRVTRPDGSAVTDAGVGAFRNATQTWIETDTNSSGNYSLLLSGGSWEVSIHPTSITPDWNSDQPPQLVVFADDATAEQQLLNFTVVVTNAQITGKVLRPDGTPPLSDSVFIDIRSSGGSGFGGPVDSTGSFRIAVTAGTYNISVWSQDQSLAAPALTSVTVGIGGTADIGTIRLVQKQDHIKGTVVDQSGQGIAGVEVSAWAPEGNDYVNITTDATGAFDLLVTPGNWEVYAFPDPVLDLYNPEPPKRIRVISGVVSTVNFTLYAADAGISGTMVDKGGNVLTNLYGHVELFQGSGLDDGFGPGIGSGPGLGGPIERGVFSLKAPAGTYTLNVFLPPESSYTAKAAQTVIAISGQTVNVTVVVAENNSQITGTIVDSNGTAVTGFDVFVFATSGKGIWQEAIVDKTTGKYTLKVSADTWYLGYHIDPSSGYLSAEGRDIGVVVAEGEIVTRNLVVIKAGSIISGQVTDSSGKGVPYVFVDVSRVSFSSEIDFTEAGDPFVAGGETNQAGFYKIAVPAGSYFVHVFLRPDLGQIAPEEKAVTIAEGESVTLNLMLRVADLKITGNVLLGETPIANVFVWGWGEKGGYQETMAKADGSFELFVSSFDIWHIAAGAEINGQFYKSDEVSVNVADVDVVQNLNLIKFDTLVSSAAKTAIATQPIVVEVEDGAGVVAPANAISTSGTVSISITPDVRTPSQGEVKVVGIAYDFEARDATGQVVSSFNTDVTITIPYKESDVQALGASEDNLGMSFWDETVATWKIVDNAVVNREDNIVTAAIDHFTRFAIVAAADITPPAVPTSVTAVSLGSGQIKLTWINPIEDFSHAKIYRSETKNELGTIQAAEVKASEFIDANNVTDGVAYYYTVRTVDLAGNESGNVDQVSVIAAGTSLATPEAPVVPSDPAITTQFARNLTIGSTGEDVTALQRFLLNEGVYPEGLITGYFGSLTRAAVTRFQEKYASEILTPLGLTRGTGYFGSSTRAKVTALLQVGGLAQEKPEVPGLQVALGKLERNLTAGSQGKDVQTLQQFLNANGFILASTGPGSPGSETEYFGPITRAAVIRFQEKYAQEILTPLGLTQGTGFFGPATRKKMEALLE